ncbi:hypothetical protein HYW54_03860 [Candidatus Gottesmanbacteria bacterium]|nr:hypothetical protein [Candidatus Gottesmanbacteria bacterium]
MRGNKFSEDIINKIRDLRTHGNSITEICVKTKVPKTTVYKYIKDVQVLPEFIQELKSKQASSLRRKILKEQLARAEGIKFVQKLSKREKLLFLSALYWAEGSKKDFGLSNTDPHLIKVFVTILREILEIDNNRLRVSIRIYEDLNKNECLTYWSDIVGIPKEQFVNVNIIAGKKKGKLKYGMCRVRIIKGGDILKKIVGINNAIINTFAPIA